MFSEVRMTPWHIPPASPTCQTLRWRIMLRPGRAETMRNRRTITAQENWGDKVLSAGCQATNIFLILLKTVETLSLSSCWHFENDGHDESLRKVDKSIIYGYITLKAFLVHLTISKVENGGTLWSCQEDCHRMMHLMTVLSAMLRNMYPSHTGINTNISQITEHSEQFPSRQKTWLQFANKCFSQRGKEAPHSSPRYIPLSAPCPPSHGRLPLNT